MMPGWIYIQNRDGNFNASDYAGVDLNPGGLSVMLANFTDAINERINLLNYTIGLPTYHTAGGDITVPVASDFIGMDFDEIFETLDDIEEGVNWLLGRNNKFVDPADLDTVYVAFTEIANDATGSPTRPDVNITDKALWNFYKDTLSRLYVVMRSVTVSNPDPGGEGGTLYTGEDFNNDDAWDEMIASAPGQSSGASIGMNLLAVQGGAFDFRWTVVDDRDMSYDFDLPSGGSILRDEFIVKPRGGDDAPGHDSGTVEKNFAISWDDPAGPNEILLVNVSSGDETYAGVSPSLFGLIQSGGIVNYQVVFASLPADPPWTRPAPSGVSSTSLNIQAFPATARMWIDYASELDFV